jgi:D-alanyl-D-alanine carboxypeptidase (penicillin-binding protein 5/6)
MKKALAFLFLFIFLFNFAIGINALCETKSEAENTSLDNPSFTVEAKSALLMEADTGKILFSQNENEAASPASVTKVMTLLLVMEAIKDGRINLTDKISVSAHASSMGGSQVFLKEGEKMSVEDLLKCTVIASANDAAVALAENVYGSEENFVSRMNERAKELGMENTNFENTTGLDDTTTNHFTSAKDIAIMSRELIKHEVILKYSSLWQDTIRDGQFTLTNTNRLVRYYDGCNGLKTGSTDKAGYCISTTAKRDGMQLIAVVMGAESRDTRNAVAKALLDYGFSNFAVYTDKARDLEKIRVLSGDKDFVSSYIENFSVLIPKGSKNKVQLFYEIPDSLPAPTKAGDVVGKITYKIGDEEIGFSNIMIKESIEKLSYFDVLIRLLKELIYS